MHVDVLVLRLVSERLREVVNEALRRAVGREARGGLDTCHGGNVENAATDGPFFAAQQHLREKQLRKNRNGIHVR